jgi:hypothetical protein
MTNESRDVPPRWRPRFSLLTALLLTTICCLVLAILGLSWSHALKDARLRYLEEENRDLNDQLGVLTIHDRAKLHSLWSNGNRGAQSKGITKTAGDMRTWKVWVPDDAAFDLNLAGCPYSSQKMPDKSDVEPIRLAAGEHTITAGIVADSKDSNPRWKLSADDQIRVIDFDWIAWENYNFGTGGVPPTTWESDVNMPLVLSRHTIADLASGKRDGMIIWLAPSKK